MRIDIKTVNDKDYIQLIDDNGFLHHVGPANASSFAAAIYLKGQYEYAEMNDWLERYYLSRSHILDEDMRKKISNIAELYGVGQSGLQLSGSEFYDLEKVNEVIDRLQKMMTLHKLVKEQLVEEYHANGIKFSDTWIRKRVKKIVREYSKDYLDKVYQKYLDYIDTQIMESLKTKKETTKN